MFRLRAIIFFAILLILFATCATGHLASSGTEIHDDFPGIVHAGGSRTDREYAYLHYLGVKWVLHSFSWIDIEPLPGEWNFSWHDALVDKANAEGVKIMGTLAYDAWWIHDDKKSHRNITAQQLPDYLEYVRATVEHFRGRVDAWSIWNEPNTSRFWKGSMEDFFALSREAANAIREIDPDVIILGGSFNRNVSGLPRKFIRGLFESGAMEKADAVAFHPYELNPARTLSLYTRFKKMADGYAFGDKIWITEVGYPTGGWYPTKVSEKKFPEYVVKTIVNLTVAGAPKILWYKLNDTSQGRKKSNSEGYFGLVRDMEDYASKGAEAFRLCAVYLAGTVYRPDLPLREGLPRSLRTFYFEQPDGSGKSLVLWKDHGSTKIKLQFAGSSYRGDYTVHDPVSGNAVEAAAGTVITVGTTPVFVTW